jgi:hypothetical protein
MGLFVGVVAVACNDGKDRVTAGRSNAEAGALGAGTSVAGDSNHGGDTGTGTDGGDTGTGTDGGDTGTGTDGGDTGAGTGGGSGTGTGGGGASSQAGTGGSSGVQDTNCNLDPEVYEDDSPSTSSTVPCGRLGDLSGATGVALDVGHKAIIESLTKTATRLVSYDSHANWVLWDVEARTMLGRGRSEPWPQREYESVPTPLPWRPALSDTHLAALASADALAFDLEIRSALDGDLIATVTMPGLSALSLFGFASDGSYLWAITRTGVSAWTTGGELLAEASGDYAGGRVSAVPGELRIALPDRNVIERISTATGNITLSAAFQGTFHSWFVDGARFLTTISSTVRVYSGASVTQENIFTLPTVPTLDNLTGQGDHVWTFGTLSYALDIYDLSDPSAPAASYDYDVYDRPFAAGNVIGVVKHGLPTIDIIELGPAITQSSVEAPGYEHHLFTADDAGNWAIGGVRGDVFESTDLTHPLSCGEVLSIARADDGTTAVGTAAGGILLFKLTAASRQYLGSIPFPSSHVELSRDGLVLAASANLNNGQPQADRSLRVFSLPDRSEIKVWPYSLSDPQFFGFSMSSQGNRFGHQTGVADDGPSWTYTQEVRDLDDNVSLSLTESVPVNGLNAAIANPPRLSADGTLVAVASGNATNVYASGVLVNAFPGTPLSWFDDNRLLVELDGAWRIYDSSGQLQPTPNLKATYDPSEVHIVSATEIYSPGFGAIYSLTSGEELWSCDGARFGPGTAAANYAVFVSGKALYKVVFDTY